MKISDTDFDKLISIALSQVPDTTDIELKTNKELSDENIPTHEFSPAFKTQMKKLIHKNQRHQASICHSKRFRSKIRIVILVAILVCAATLFSVSAFRTSIANFFFDLSAESSNLEFDDNTKSISPEFDKYLPTYIPDGFTIYAIQEIPQKSIYLQFANENNNYFEVQCDTYLSNISIDTEGAHITELKINNANVTICERKDRIIAIYAKNNMFYSIAGNITQEEILKILESIPL